MSKVSIILPVYNALSFIDETIMSVLSQTFKEWELIIVDDCSSDGTFDYLKNKYMSFFNIHVLQNPVNSGAGVTRNHGVKMATCSMVAFIDADDLWMPSKLQVQYDLMSKNNYAITHTSYSFVDEKTNKIPGKVSVSDNVTLRSYMRNTEIGMSTSMVNRDITGDLLFHPMRTRQDTRLWLGLLSKGFVSHGIKDELVLYRVRSGQISGNKVVVSWRTLKLFLTVDSISIFERLINFSFYAFNGIYKRLNK
jgi:teichuronic acid biosynthesis glycosyltransferase TuaG